MNNKNTHIITTAIHLFAKEGVGVSTAKIAKVANVSNGTLFNYFETKQVLIDSVYVHIKTRMASYIIDPINLEGELHDIFLDVWLSFARWCKENPLEKTTLDLLKTSQVLSDDVMDEGNQAWLKIDEKVDQGITDGILIKLPDDLACSICEGILDSTLSYIQSRNIPQSEVASVIEKSFNIFWKGITK